MVCVMDQGLDAKTDERAGGSAQGSKNNHFGYPVSTHTFLKNKVQEEIIAKDSPYTVTNYRGVG